MTTIFTTPRLLIRRALPTEPDAAFYVRLWGDPRVMANVGYPQGLKVSPEQMMRRLSVQGPSVLGALLLVNLKPAVSGIPGPTIGECFMGKPDERGISITDVKLLPNYWGHGYGVEIKRGLVRYLFDHTDCQAVEATPNVNNPASIRMQEAVGGIRVSESTDEIAPGQVSSTVPVHHYVYHVTRKSFIDR